MSDNLFVIRLLLSFLATFRFAQFIVYDNGPFKMMRSLRLFLGKRAMDSKFAEFLADVVNCPYCSGLWIALFFSIFVLFPNRLIDFVMLVLSIAGAQTFLEYMTEKGER